MSEFSFSVQFAPGHGVTAPFFNGCKNFRNVNDVDIDKPE
jgi:hypothetical protein